MSLTFVFISLNSPPSKKFRHVTACRHTFIEKTSLTVFPPRAPCDKTKLCVVALHQALCGGHQAAILSAVVREAPGVRHRGARGGDGEGAPLRGDGAQRAEVQQALAGRGRSASPAAPFVESTSRPNRGRADLASRVCFLAMFIQAKPGGRRNSG